MWLIRKVLKVWFIRKSLNKPLDYLRLQLEAIKEGIQEDIAEAFSKIIIVSVILVMSLFVLLFASLTLAMGLNQVLNNNMYGYGIVTGIYLIVVLVCYLLRNRNFIYQSSRKYAGLLIRPKVKNKMRS